MDQSIRSVILQNIKLKDRLYSYLIKRSRKPALEETRWERCRRCQDSEYPGYLLLEPRYDGLHPSQIGHPCLLKVYNDIVGVGGQERVEPRTELIFDLGHAVHHMFQAYGRDGAWGQYYKPEIEVSGKFYPLAAALMIEGHADADNILVIDDIPDAPVYEVGLVHEYKTTNKNNFDKLHRPKPNHKQQAMLYSAAMNRPVVVYLYMNKDDQNLCDFPVEFEPDLWNVIKSKAEMLMNCYEHQNPPPPEVGFHCRECMYRDTCAPYKQTRRG